MIDFFFDGYKVRARHVRGDSTTVLIENFPYTFVPTWLKSFRGHLNQAEITSILEDYRANALYFTELGKTKKATEIREALNIV